MRNIRKFVTLGAALVALSTAGGCSSTGGLGNILGSVLGGGSQNQQLSGYVNGVDTRNRSIVIQQQNGQSIAVAYDQNTQVVYNNQNYAVTSLENGDQVTLRLQQTSNGAYYTDLVQVDQSVRNSSGSVYQSGNVQMFEGGVRSINYQQGWFTMNGGNGGVINVTLGGSVNRNDVNRFNNLRVGDFVRLYGVYTGNNSVQLRQFQ